MATAQATPRATAPKKKRSPLKVLLILALLAIAGWAALTYLAGAPKTILLMGTDEDGMRTDVLIVAHVDPKQRLVNLISIPRDTLVAIPCEQASSSYCLDHDKINHAHVYGGSELTKAAAERLLGVNIDHYVLIDYDGFEHVVDALGGVSMVIDQDMYYEDPYANPPLVINFKASSEPQHLTGEEALKYVRYRGDGRGDIGRVERTKVFAKALFATMKENGNLLKLPMVASTMLGYVETDMDAKTAITLATVAPRLTQERIGTAMIEGAAGSSNYGAWVWVPDEASLHEIVERMIKNPQPPQDSVGE